MSPQPPPVDRSVSHAANPARHVDNRRDVALELSTLLAPAFGDGSVPTGDDTGDDARDDSDRAPRIDVVDIGANPIGGDPPYRVLLDAGLCRVTGFEPQPQALAELHRLAGPHEQYLPYAVGDGGTHTLHLCASSGFASLLEPDRRQLALLIDFPELAEVTGREQLPTKRLDDIDEISAIDYLKIDIQGGELAVLTAGRGKLERAVAVQTEVGFHRLYRDQPTFADVDLELRAQGFVPHQFVATRTWPLAPVVWADPLEKAARHLVEADLLYVRDPVLMDQFEPDQLARLALIADAVYGSFGLALRCVRALITRGALTAAAEGRYRELTAARLLG